VLTLNAGRGAIVPSMSVEDGMGSEILLVPLELDETSLLKYHSSYVSRSLGVIFS